MGETLRLEAVWDEAHVKSDVEALDRLWADDIAVTAQGMPVIGKKEALAVWRAGRMKFDRYDTSERRIRVYGDSAIVTGRLQRSRRMGDRGRRQLVVHKGVRAARRSLAGRLVARVGRAEPLINASCDAGCSQNRPRIRFAIDDARRKNCNGCGVSAHVPPLTIVQSRDNTPLNLHREGKFSTAALGRPIATLRRHDGDPNVARDQRFFTSRDAGRGVAYRHRLRDRDPDPHQRD